MWIEISVGIIALSFLTLVIFLCITLVRTRKTMDKTDELLLHVKELTADIQKKAETLDLFFKPLEGAKKYTESAGVRSKCEKIAEILEIVPQVVLLVGKIREDLKNYVKSR